MRYLRAGVRAVKNKTARDAAAKEMEENTDRVFMGVDGLG